MTKYPKASGPSTSAGQCFDKITQLLDHFPVSSRPTSTVGRNSLSNSSKITILIIRCPYRFTRNPTILNIIWWDDGSTEQLPHLLMVQCLFWEIGNNSVSQCLSDFNFEHFNCTITLKKRFHFFYTSSLSKFISKSFYIIIYFCFSFFFTIKDK
jgi:hypothetical protein